MAYNSTTWSEDTSTKASETTSVALNNASLSGSLTVNGGITSGGANQLNSTLTVGINDTGYDVKFFGATATNGYMLWDESRDDLILGSASYIGVGRTDPSAPLHLTSSTQREMLKIDTANFSFQLGEDVDLDNFCRLRLNSGDGFHFTGNDDGPDLTILSSSGNVGVGTAAPASKFHVTGTVQVGVAGTGHDVTFYSATSGDHFLWDASEEKLSITGTNGQIALELLDGNLAIALGDKFYIDGGGDTYIWGTTSANQITLTCGGTGLFHAEYVDGAGNDYVGVPTNTKFKIGGPTAAANTDTYFIQNPDDNLQLFVGSREMMLWDQDETAGGYGTITVGVEGEGCDVKFFGETSSKYLLWDQSEDALELTDSSPIKIGDGGDMTIYHYGSHSYVTNATGTLKLATETSGIAVSIGHTISETTVNDNLTITGDLTVTGNNISGSGGSIITFSGDDIRLADNLALNTDDSKISFGVHSDVQLIHVPDEGLRHYTNSDATDSVVDLLTLYHQTSATAADGIGIGIKFTNEDDAGNANSIGNFDCIMTDASNGSENSDFSWRLFTDGSEYERMRLTDAGDLQIDGDLTVEGDDIVIGGSDDATDKTVLFRHHAVATIMGIDDSADRFVINTDASFDGTIADNDFSIDASGNAYILGDLQVGNDIRLTTDSSLLYFGVNSEVNITHVHNEGLILKATSANTDSTASLLRLFHQTSATPAVGIGTDMVFRVQTSGENFEDGMQLETITTNITDDEENFDFVVKLMEDGSPTAERMRLTSGGNLSTAGYLVEGRTQIKVKATDFHSNDDVTGVAYGTIEDDGSNYGVRGSVAGTNTLYAYIDIPLGYTATKVKILGSDTGNEVQVFTLDLDDGTISSEISNTGLNVGDNTDLDTNHVGADDKILLIKAITSANDDIIYGGYVTIEAT